jgi:hypothetical protein
VFADIFHLYQKSVEQDVRIGGIRQECTKSWKVKGERKKEGRNEVELED